MVSRVYPHDIPTKKKLSFRYVMEVQFNMFMGCIILSYYHGYILSSRVFVLSIMHNINDILCYISIYIYIYISIYNIYPYYPGYIIHISMISFDSSKNNQEVSPRNIGTSRAKEMIFLQEPKGNTTRNYHSSMVIISINDKHININDKLNIYIYIYITHSYQYLSISL